MYYNALLEQNAGRSFALPREFTISEAAAGRALAAKYPNLLLVVEQVLKEWRSRPLGEVLNATQLAGALSHYETSAEDRVIACLRAVAKEIHDIRITDFGRYRLAHHVWEAYAEATGDTRISMTAVDLASKFLHWELRHLEGYGWRVGVHVIDLYAAAARNVTLRGQKLRRYNEGMRELMGEALR